MKSSMIVSIFLVGLSMYDVVASSFEQRQEEVTFQGERSTKSFSYVCYRQPQYPRDCKELYDQREDQSADGVYLIKPEGYPEPFEVYCNNSIDGGGWTVLQRRVDGSVDFNRDWNAYKKGFGFLRREFWLGNDKISFLTNQKNYELRIDLINRNGELYFAKYSLFRISDEGTKYRLVGLGDYNPASTANNDALAYARGYSFTTRDQDNDNDEINCAKNCKSGWWFGYIGDRRSCGAAILNNRYSIYQEEPNCDSIRWMNLPKGDDLIKYTEMKIRPVEE